jgi:predicted phage terminase large subunit-like protein
VTKTTEDNYVYILEALALKVTPDKLIDKIFELATIYEVSTVKIETVQAQILLADLVKKRAFKENSKFILEEYHPGTKETKAARIRGLIPHYANGRILHAPGLGDLEQQLTQFPRGKHDDMIDALSAQVGDWSGIKIYEEDKVAYHSGAWWKQRLRPVQKELKDLFTDL